MDRPRKHTDQTPKLRFDMTGCLESVNWNKQIPTEIPESSRQILPVAYQSRTFWVGERYLTRTLRGGRVHLKQGRWRFGWFLFKCSFGNEGNSNIPECPNSKHTSAFYRFGCEFCHTKQSGNSGNFMCWGEILTLPKTILEIWKMSFLFKSGVTFTFRVSFQGRKK